MSNDRRQIVILGAAVASVGLLRSSLGPAFPLPEPLFLAALIGAIVWQFVLLRRVARAGGCRPIWRRFRG
jgi:hypothetical protein